MARLRILNGHQRGQVFLLRPPGPLRIGRDPEAEFPLFDRSVSRELWALEFLTRGYLLTEVGTEGRTEVNDKCVRRALLRPGDVIRSGRVQARFELESADDPLIGRDLGNYALVEHIRSGGMGSVYRAEQKSLHRMVALKVLPGGMERGEDFVRRLVEEAKAAAQLDHPQIVRVYDVDVVDGVLFYAMEFMAQGSVRDLLRRQPRLSVARVVEIGGQCAVGLAHAARSGIVHRDIKPENLLVHENGEVKISDLGLALPLDGETSRRGLCGTPHYMAPEVALQGKLDERTDLYALGATLFELFSGRPPFPRESLKDLLRAHLEETPPSLRELRPDVPATLASLVERLLAKDPLDRPQSADEVSAVLAAEASEHSDSGAVHDTLGSPKGAAGARSPDSASGGTPPSGVAAGVTPRRPPLFWVLLSAAFALGGALGWAIAAKVLPL